MKEYIIEVNGIEIKVRGYHQPRSFGDGYLIPDTPECFVIHSTSVGGVAKSERELVALTGKIAVMEYLEEEILLTV